MGLFAIIGKLLSADEIYDKQKSREEANADAEVATEATQQSGVVAQSQTSAAHKPANTCVPLENKDRIAKAVCATVAKYLDDASTVGDKKLIVWLDTDGLNFQTYNTSAFRQQLQNALRNECDAVFMAVEFCIGRPAEELHCTPIGESGKAFIQILGTEQATVSRTAAVSIFGNSGSLLKEKYILSSDELKMKMMSAYNIGAGEFPQLPSGFRQNHIAIDDNPNCPMADKNKFVSRMHAHIGFSNKFGFYLQVERDGTRLMGKRTRIFRGEQIIELDNPQIKEPLQNGDIIELGKAVMLQFAEQ